MRVSSKTPAVQLMVYMPAEMRARLRQLALDRETTASALVREAIEGWLRVCGKDGPRA